MSTGEFAQLVEETFEEKGEEYATMGAVDPKYD